MLKISWAEINSIGPVIHVLATSPKVDKTASYRAGRIMAVVQRSIKNINSEREKIWVKYCDKDENLNPKKDENGNFIFTKEDVAKTCADEVFELFKSNYLEVKCQKLPYEGVKDHLTGNEMVAIESIVEGIPEII